MKCREIAVMTAMDTHKMKDFEHRLAEISSECSTYMKNMDQELTDLLLESVFFIALAFERCKEVVTEDQRIIKTLMNSNYAVEIYESMAEKVIDQLTPILSYGYRLEITDCIECETGATLTILFTNDITTLQLNFSGIAHADTFRMRLYMFDGKADTIFLPEDPADCDAYQSLLEALQLVLLNLLHSSVTNEHALRHRDEKQSLGPLFE